MIQTQNYKQTEPQSPKAKRLTAGVTFLLVCIAWMGVILGSWYYYNYTHNYYSFYIPGARVPICGSVDCVSENLLEHAEKHQGVIDGGVVFINKDYLNEIFDYDIQFDMGMTVYYPSSFGDEDYTHFQYNRIKQEIEKEQILYEEKNYNGLSLIQYKKYDNDRTITAVYLFDFSENIFVDCVNSSNQVNKHCDFNAALCKNNTYIRVGIFRDNIDRYFEVKKFLDDFSNQLHTTLVAKHGPKKGKCNHVEG